MISLHCRLRSAICLLLKKTRRGKRPGGRRHTPGSGYGCFLSDLTRFPAERCIGPGRFPRRGWSFSRTAIVSTSWALSIEPRACYGFEPSDCEKRTFRRFHFDARRHLHRILLRARFLRRQFFERRRLAA